MHPPYLKALQAIFYREFLRFMQQYARLFSALVRPLVWLFIFAAGFRSILGVSITPPYETYVLYETYITPGLCAMVLLFNGMQGSLSMIYDKEVGSMKLLLSTPLPHWYLLFAKSLATVSVGVLQVYIFLLVAWFWGVPIAPMGFVVILPYCYLVGLMCSSLGLLLSSTIKQLENFAGVMNFVIFPMFFASSALYPLWRVQESSLLLYYIALFNPFTHAVELLRFALYAQHAYTSFVVVTSVTLLSFVLAHHCFRWQG